MKLLFWGLQLMFIGFKIAKVIDWSWWIVISPLITLAIVINILLAYLGYRVWINRKFVKGALESYKQQ